MVSIKNRLRTKLIEKSQKGSTFVKSKHLADELDCSAQQIGQRMSELEENSKLLEIEKWSNDRPYTYSVELVMDELLDMDEGK